MSQSDVDEEPSQRLLDQRFRNRLIEAVETLAAGDEGVLRVWPSEYFESFYDWIPHRHDRRPRSNGAINAEEQAALGEVSRMLDDACDATPKMVTADELIATGWPDRIKPVARRALDLMLTRGRFSDDREETEPSVRI